MFIICNFDYVQYLYSCNVSTSLRDMKKKINWNWSESWLCCVDQPECACVCWPCGRPEQKFREHIKEEPLESKKILKRSDTASFDDKDEEVSSGCVLDMSGVCPECTLHVFSVSWVCLGCVLNIPYMSSVCPGYVWGVSWTYPTCVFSLSSVCVGCVLNVPFVCL